MNADFNVKKTFEIRLWAEWIFTFGWGLTTPIFKHSLNTIPVEILALAGIWVLMSSLSQKPLREKVSLKQLLWILIYTDLIYITGLVVFISVHNLTYLLMFEIIFEGPYMAILLASTSKLNIEYYNLFSKEEREKKDAYLKDISIKVKILAFIAGGILGYITDSIFIAFSIKICVIILGVLIELRALK